MGDYRISNTDVRRRPNNDPLCHPAHLENQDKFYVPNGHPENARETYVLKRKSCHTQGRRSDDDKDHLQGVSPVEN